MGRRAARLGTVATLVWVATVAVALTAPALSPASPASMETGAITAPSRRHGSFTARILTPTAARTRPGGGRIVSRLAPATAWSGQPQVLLVLRAGARHGHEWLRVLLPIRPVGSSGWIPRDRVVLGSTPYWITVDKSARRVTTYRAGRRVRSTRAVVGKPATPTPGGLAAIYEKVRQPDRRGFLGPWALPLTALSKVLRNFGGGPGRVAIHGRAGASLLDPLGSALSHGCIRVDNGPITWMARHLPPGTPVEIRS